MRFNQLFKDVNKSNVSNQLDRNWNEIDHISSEFQEENISHSKEE